MKREQSMDLEIDKMLDEELNKNIENISVYARVSQSIKSE